MKSSKGKKKTQKKPHVEFNTFLFFILVTNDPEAMETRES